MVPAARTPCQSWARRPPSSTMWLSSWKPKPASTGAVWWPWCPSPVVAALADALATCLAGNKRELLEVHVSCVRRRRRAHSEPEWEAWQQ